MQSKHKGQGQGLFHLVKKRTIHEVTRNTLNIVPVSCDFVWISWIVLFGLTLSLPLLYSTCLSIVLLLIRQAFRREAG